MSNRRPFWMSRWDWFKLWWLSRKDGRLATEFLRSRYERWESK